MEGSFPDTYCHVHQVVVGYSSLLWQRCVVRVAWGTTSDDPAAHKFRGLSIHPMGRPYPSGHLVIKSLSSSDFWNLAICLYIQLALSCRSARSDPSISTSTSSLGATEIVIRPQNLEPVTACMQQYSTRSTQVEVHPSGHLTGTRRMSIYMTSAQYCTVMLGVVNRYRLVPGLATGRSDLPGVTGQPNREGRSASASARGDGSSHEDIERDVTTGESPPGRPARRQKKHSLLPTTSPLSGWDRYRSRRTTESCCPGGVRRPARAPRSSGMCACRARARPGLPRDRHTHTGR